MGKILVIKSIMPIDHNVSRKMTAHSLDDDNDEKIINYITTISQWR